VSITQKKKLIDVFFKDKDAYTSGDFLDYEKILQKLRDENLLKLKKTVRL